MTMFNCTHRLPHTQPRFGRWLACGLLTCAAAVQAAMPAMDPDWKETDAPTAPAFSTSQLLPIEMPSYVSL